MIKNLQEPTVQVSARRKLVRGAFSLPAVLAVHNGSALAASSNKFRCATNAVSSNQSLPASSVLATDNWLRVQRYKLTSNNVPFVRIADINSVAALLGITVAIPGVNSSTTVIKWADGSLQTDAVGLFQTDGTNLVALRFDSGGTVVNPIRIVGIVTSAQSSGASPPGTNAITQSCWTSIKMV